jgi:two-component system, chemotaxis family, chemotaxis protein CheY
MKILVADDSSFARVQLKQLLAAHGHAVVAEAANAAQAVELYGVHKPDVVTMDLNMPGSTGLEAIVALRDLDPKCRIVLVTAARDDAAVHGIAEMGVPVVLKPIQWGELERALAQP